MQLETYKNIIDASPIGFAYHKIILDENDKPIDYVFLEINKAFEEQTGFIKEEVINKKVTEVLPGIEDGEFDWIGFYGDVALNGGNKVFEQYSLPLRKWYKVQVYSDAKYYFATLVTDITESKQKADTLEEFFTINLDLLCIADFEANFIRVNKEWEKVLGYSIEDLEKRKFLDFVHPDDMDKTLEAVSQLGKNKTVINFINRYRTKNGDYRFIEWRSQPKEGLIYAAARDITDHIKTEEELREKELFISTLIESAPLPIFYKDKEGRYLGLNKAFSDFLGMSKSDIIGKTVFDINPLEVAKVVQEKDKEILIKKSKQSYETKIQNSLGEFRDISFYKDTILNTYGEIIGLVGLFLDITDQKKINNEIKQLHENYDIFFNTIDDFLFVLNDEGNIIKVNDTVIKRLGYSEEELLGQSVLMVHPPERRAEAGRIVSEMLRGVAEFCPVPLETKTGVQIPVETRVSQGTWDGKPAIFGVTKDISQIRLSEEKFSKLFYLSPFAAGLSDLETGKYLEVNNAFIKLLGYEQKEVIGETATSLGILDEQSKQKILENVDSNGRVINVETELRAKDGEIKRVLISGESIYIQDKQFRFTVVNDITELTRMNNLLEESEKLQRSLIENITVGILIIEPTTRTIEFINSFAENLLGERKEAVIGSKCHQYLCPEADILCPICDIGMKEDTSERTLIRFDKKEVKILKTVKEIFIKGERKLLESFVDITIQKEAEALLFQSNQKLEAMFAASPDGIGIISLDTKIEFASKNLINMFGYTSEEPDVFIGSSVQNFFEPNSYLAMFANIKRLMTEKQVNNIREYVAIKKDKSRFTMEVNTSLLISSDGSKKSVLFVARDITERKELEETIHESEKQHRLLFEMSQEGIAIVDHGRIVYFNPKLLEITGFNKDEIINKYFEDIYSHDYQDQMNYGHKTESISGLINHEFIYKINRKDRNLRWVIMRSKSIDWQGRKSYIHFLTDITKQKIAETELIELNQDLKDSKSLIEENLYETNLLVEELTQTKNTLEKTNIEKDKLFSIIAHDLRSPFLGFMGMTEMLSDDPAAFSEQELKEIGQNMHKSANNVYKLLDNLLTWAHLQKGTISFEPKEHNLFSISLVNIQTINQRAYQKGIEIFNEIPEDYMVFTDEKMLDSVFRNLLANAVKFTKSNGKIIVSASEIDNGFIKVSIKDSGIGMPEDLVGRLFQIDQKVGRKGTDGEESTGLGLLLCKEFVEKNGGEIKVESEEGKGSTFSFTVPIRDLEDE